MVVKPETHKDLKRVTRICRFWLMLVIIHFRKYHIWNTRRKRTDESISRTRWRNFTPSSPACSNNGWQTRGKQADKAFKRWNNKAKRKEILVSKTEQEIFQPTKLVIETTSSKPLALAVDQTAKPKQTSLALCLRFLPPWHYQEIKKFSQKVGFTWKNLDTKISRHDTNIFNTVELKRTV